MKAEIFRRFSEDSKTLLIIESIDFVRQQSEYYTMKTKEQTLTDNIKCGLGDNIKGVKHHEIMNAMQEYAESYARIQIEKDREEVIENTPLIDRIKLIETYSNTPINLD